MLTLLSAGKRDILKYQILHLGKFHIKSHWFGKALSFHTVIFYLTTYIVNTNFRNKTHQCLLCC